MTSFSLNPVPPAETLLESDADVCAAAERVAAAFEARPFESEPEGRIVAVTWNVWFAPTAFDQRLRALVLEVLEVAPDLVGLQEVTPRFEAARVLDYDNADPVYSVNDTIVLHFDRPTNKAGGETSGGKLFVDGLLNFY